MRKKWIKLFPLLIGAVIAYCLLWYVIPQNKGGEVAAILVAAILLFFFILLRFVIGKNKKKFYVFITIEQPKLIRNIRV